MSDIDALKAEVARLQAELNAAEGALENALRDAAPFKVGDAVIASHRRNDWRPAIVRDVEVADWREPWYRVSFAKNDGQWSASVLNVFDRVRPFDGMGSANGRGDSDE